MTVDKQSVKEELEQTEGMEFDYNGEVASINAIKEGESHVDVGHFVVARSHRRQGIGSTIFEALLEILNENDIYSATVSIQALEDGSEDDPVMDFLREYGFQHEGLYEDPKWGRCIKAYGYV